MATRYRKIPALSEQDIQHFQSKIRLGNQGDCWEWQAYKRRGYGRFWLGQTLYSAHRIAYFLHYQVDPGHLLVCHKCDNPSCVNPQHLFLGSHLENKLDCCRKGRNKGNIHIHCKERPDIRHKGEQTPWAILTESDVLRIRQIHAAKEATLSAIAQMFGVKTRTIEKVVYRQTWKHVP